MASDENKYGISSKDKGRGREMSCGYLYRDSEMITVLNSSWTHLSVVFVNIPLYNDTGDHFYLMKREVEQQ